MAVFNGTSGKDTIVGTSSQDHIDGQQGYDTIYAGGGNDMIWSYDTDYLDGGSGVDLAIISRANSFVGITLDLTSPTVSQTLADGTTLVGIDQVDFTATLYNDNLTGGTFGDTLRGLNGDDYLNGGPDNDFLYGGQGADVVEGGQGYDNLYGEAGDDVLLSYGGSDFISGGTGWDYAIISRTNSSVEFTISLASGDYQELADGTEIWLVEQMSFTGGSGDDHITGGTLADELSGGAGSDQIWGGDGADNLYGNAGFDQLFGGSGNDKLVGGAGLDYLTGGANADRFVFVATSESSVGSPDYIADFSSAQGDRIDVSPIDANVYAGGNQAFTFIGNAAFSGTPGEINYYHAGGDTYIQMQTGTAVDVESVIRLDGIVTPQASWFVL